MPMRSLVHHYTKELLTHWGRDKMAAIFKCISLNENVWISIKISLNFVPRGSINNIPALVQIMLGAGQATSHYLKQSRFVYWRIYASLGFNELICHPALMQFPLNPFDSIGQLSVNSVQTSYSLKLGNDQWLIYSGSKRECFKRQTTLPMLDFVCHILLTHWRERRIYIIKSITKEISQKIMQNTSHISEQIKCDRFILRQAAHGITLTEKSHLLIILLELCLNMHKSRLLSIYPWKHSRWSIHWLRYASLGLNELKVCRYFPGRNIKCTLIAIPLNIYICSVSLIAEFILGYTCRIKWIGLYQ